MYQIRFSKLLYVVVLFALVACQAQATPPAPTAIPATVAPTSVPPTAVPTAAPTNDLTVFSSKTFELPLSVSIGAEWSVADEYPDVVTLVTQENYVDTAFIIVKNAKIAGPEAPFTTVAFPDDFITWIQAHGLFHVAGTQPVVVGGFQGIQINANATVACGVKRDWLFLQSTGWNCRQGEYYRFIYLSDVNGVRVLIMNSGGDDLSAADFKAGVEASQKVLDTAVFTKPPAAQAPTNADAIAGTWSGTAKGGDFSFQITTSIGQACAIGSVCGPFDIPAIPCSGTWTLMGISGTTYQMQAGSFKGKCSGGGSSDSLQLLPDGTLLYVSTGSYDEEKGVLQRVITQAANPQLVEYKLPTSASEPGGIVAGPDGALWFVETAVNKIGRISTDGVVTEYPVPTTSAIDTDQGFLAVGPDGALWFVEKGANQIGRITATGKLSEYPLPQENSVPLRITVGPDKPLWFSLRGAKQIGRISLDGKITTFEAGMGPVGIAAGADGALWFTGYDTTEVGRLTTDGVLTKVAIPTYASIPYHITAGPDGSMWFTEQQGNQIGQIQLSAP